MQPRRKQGRFLAAVGVLALAATGGASGSPYFLIDSQAQWQTALGGGGGGGRVLEFPAAEWLPYMTHWTMNLVEGAPYPTNMFKPAQLYVWGGGGGGGLNPEDAGLVMVWGGPTTPLGSYSSAWKFDYQLDPDLTNCTITITVTAPQFDHFGNQINAVSFGIQDVALAIRSWQWAVGPPGAPIPWNTPTTITINTALWGVAAATPVATGFANNPLFNITQSQFFIVDENANWVGGPTPVPPPGQLMPGMWNYWHNLMVSPNIPPKGNNPTKWSQPPVEVQPAQTPPLFNGWDERSDYYWGPPIVADDWLCTDNRPVTDIHWWGSFLGWDQPYPPQLPDAFRIAIWTDVPAGGATEPFSHPGQVIWEYETTSSTNYRWNFAGYDRDPRMPAGTDWNETCFQFNLDLPPLKWFYQQPGPSGQNVYWLSIAAVYAPFQPLYPWGWKTRPHFYNDDAVRIWQVTPAWPPVWLSQWVQGEPIEYPAGTSWDVAFELTTTEPDLDFGDAPDQPYPTLLVNDGARHVIVPGVFLGVAIDAEANGQPDPNALGDDNNGVPDDEDGVVFTSPIIPGQAATVDVTASVAGVLYAWIDFNNDGSWAQLGDQIFAGQGLNAGLNSLSFNVPATASGGVMTFARFRFTTDTTAILGYTGLASDGEVEDYQVWIEEGSLHELGDAPDSTNTFGALMMAYPPGGPPGVIANFPTVYMAGSPPFGPIHRLPLNVAWLGQGVSRENEADIGPDEDPSNNILPMANTPDRDGFDDGVLFPLVLPRCKPATFQFVVTVANVPGGPLYVNAWFDWNRDGDWDDWLPCAMVMTSEWAVQNQPLVFAGPGQYVITTPPFLPWHPAQPLRPGPIWMRITLSEQQWAPGGGLGDGGSGPPQGYEFGETEDYYFEPQLPPPPVITAVTSWAAHGSMLPWMELGLPIALPPSIASVIEPRKVVVANKPNVYLAVTFDKPMQVGPQSVASNPAILGLTATGDGTPVVRVTYPVGLVDQVCYRISLAGSVAVDGGVAGASANFCVCYLEGDVSRNGTVFSEDKTAITSGAVWGTPVTPGTASLDLDRDGSIFSGDKTTVTSGSNWGTSPSACPP